MFNQLLESPLLTAMFVTAFVLTLLLVVYVVFKVYDTAVQRYRRALYREAARLARENPEWLAEVVERHNLEPADAPTKEIALYERRARRGFSIDTAPRKELEAYAYRLQGALLELRGHYLEEQSRNSELEHKLEWAINWKRKHWRRIQRVDEALKNNADVFAALHPKLAREQNS